MTSLSKNIQDLRERKALVEMGGGEAAIEKQVAMGKLTARERIITLLDKNSFHEYDLFVDHDGRDFGMENKVLHGDGVITGTGTIFGAPICIYAQDFTVAVVEETTEEVVDTTVAPIVDTLAQQAPVNGVN